jgi:hypothetical protein
LNSASLPKRAFACIAVSAASLAVPAVAQVYKCTDRNGHVTYQQEPCSGGQKGGTVELSEPVTVQPGAKESQWSAAAREGRATVGMPKPFVTEALGRAAGIRTPRAGEIGTEVWVYPKGGQVTRIGFQDNVVAWIRTDVVEPSPRPGAPAAVVPDREARVRQALVVGRPCDSALSEGGPPDREEPLTVGAQGGGTRYIYTFDSNNANAYAAFVCIGGRITGVERYVPGK